MTKDNHGMPLTVTVPADEWAALRRRAAFLEAALVQVLRDGYGIKEWFSAAELAALALPGLPKAKNAVTRLAGEEKWTWREITCQGGRRRLYHFSNLPRRAFEALIDRVLKNPPPGSEYIGTTIAAPAPERIKPARQVADLGPNAVPPWSLPLMRLVKGKGASLDHALAELPRHLPEGVACPDRAAALAFLRERGMFAV